MCVYIYIYITSFLLSGLILVLTCLVQCSINAMGGFRERVCCLLVIDSVTSTPQWMRQPEPRDVHHVCVLATVLCVNASVNLCSKVPGPFSPRTRPCSFWHFGLVTGVLTWSDAVKRALSCQKGVSSTRSYSSILHIFYFRSQITFFLKESRQKRSSS